ncbi:MAG: aminotransferase class V-fold PLP-dependent enzyme [bacterium]|nr:aminotransferase class V-fold PLP-dependent enzyme [bacterium]
MNNELFLLDPDITFLNHGSFGACPREVFEEYQSWQRKLELRPVEFLGRRSSELLEKARKKLASFLGASFENLLFITNTTTGINTIVRSLNLQPNDEILTTDHEYGACDNAWEFICQSSKAKYKKIHIPLPFTSNEDFITSFTNHITPNTKVIYLSHISSTTALIFPVEEICRIAREKGIITVIDGAHAPGQLPLNLNKIDSDFYVGNCHKWLCAPKGCAFLYARPEHHSLLHGLVISWGYSTKVEGHTSFDAYTGSTLLVRRHQWQGTRDISPFLTVEAAIDFQEKYQWENVRMECHLLAVETEQRINKLTHLPSIAPESAFGQMIAIPVPTHSPGDDPEKLKATLYDEYHIEVPITGFDGNHFVRASFQGYNTQEDADALVTAIKEIFRL